MFVLLFVVVGCSSAGKTQHEQKPRQSIAYQIPDTLAANGPLAIDVVYPTEDQIRPHVDSNFIFGSVGTSEAILAINGSHIPVARNGAFLAYLKIPNDGRYELIAYDSLVSPPTTDSVVVQLSAPVSNRTERNLLSPIESSFQKPLHATIVKGSDTLETGSDAIPASPEPNGDRKWQWTRGTKLLLNGKMGSEYHAELAKGLSAWIPDTSVSIDTQQVQAVAGIGLSYLQPDSGFVDWKIAAHFAPYFIEADRNSIALTFYNSSFSHEPNPITDDPLIQNIRAFDSANSAHIDFRLSSPVWGYKAFYEKDGFFTLRIRRPPVLDPAEPLRGLTVMLDPGHPPGGAIGPTRLTEAEANLAIALRVRDKLLARGAIVVMTRTTSKPIVSSTDQAEEIRARSDSALHSNADLLISIHNNAFPEGTDPFENNGTSTYYFYPFASGLAEALDSRIEAVTGIPNLGARKRSLAMVRPTWMPCALTESLYMMFPEQEAALRDPVFLDKLAEAHLKGIEDFLIERMEKP